MALEDFRSLYIVHSNVTAFIQHVLLRAQFYSTDSLRSNEVILQQTYNVITNFPSYNLLDGTSTTGHIKLLVK